jgi:hypothetical protein
MKAEQSSSILCTGCGRPFAAVTTDDSERSTAVLKAVPQQSAQPPQPRARVVLTMRLTALERGIAD